MDKPKSLKRVGEDKYVIKGSNNAKQTFEATGTHDGNHLIIISGTGLDTWKIREYFTKEDRKPIAIAVLDKNDELVGIALGNGDTGTRNPIPFFGNGHVTIRGILDNDDKVRNLSEVVERKIVIEHKDGMPIIKKQDADDLSTLVNIDRKPQSKKVIPEDRIKIPEDDGVLFNNIQLKEASLKSPRKTPVIAANPINKSRSPS